MSCDHYGYGFGSCCGIVWVATAGWPRLYFRVAASDGGLRDAGPSSWADNNDSYADPAKVGGLRVWGEGDDRIAIVRRRDDTSLPPDAEPSTTNVRFWIVKAYDLSQASPVVFEGGLDWWVDGGSNIPSTGMADIAPDGVWRFGRSKGEGAGFHAYDYQWTDNVYSPSAHQALGAHVLQADGTPLKYWEEQLGVGEGGRIFYSELDSDSNIYLFAVRRPGGVAVNSVDKVTPAGGLAWSVPSSTLGGGVLARVAPNGRTFAYYPGGPLSALDPDGSLAWQKAAAYAPVAAARDGGALVRDTGSGTGTHGVLRRFDPSGAELWSYPLTFAFESAAVDADGNVIVGGKRRLAYLDPDGELAWEVDVLAALYERGWAFEPDDPTAGVGSGLLVESQGGKFW